MSSSRQTIAIAGVGNLGKYICEELLASPDFDVIVLTRGNDHAWCRSHNIPIYTTNYTIPSLLPILNSTGTTTIISFVNNLPPALYISTHSSLLLACQQSTTCKRLIPSEWIGDVESHPLKPRFYAESRVPFRQLLKQQNDVEWTLFNMGWLADYFLPSKKTHMTPLPDLFPVDPNAWRACVRGSGDELQSWTCGREVGRAVAELCRAEQWEPITYIAAEWSTFNASVTVMENFYEKPLPKSYKPTSEIRSLLQTFEAKVNENIITAQEQEEYELLQIEEMMVDSALAVPREKTLRHREKYFSHLDFKGLEDLLRYSETVEFV